MENPQAVQRIKQLESDNAELRLEILRVKRQRERAWKERHEYHRQCQKLTRQLAEARERLADPTTQAHPHA